MACRTCICKNGQVCVYAVKNPGGGIMDDFLLFHVISRFGKMQLCSFHGHKEEKICIELILVIGSGYGP